MIKRKMKFMTMLLGISVISMIGCGQKEQAEELKNAQMETSQSVEEESKETEAEETEETIVTESFDVPEWSLAYADYLTNGFDLSEKGMNDFSYDFAYIDDDDIPEIWIDTNVEAGGEIVLSYFDGQVYANQLSRIGSRYIEKSGLILTDTGHMDYYPVEINKLENGELTLVKEGVSYLSDENLKKLSEDENAEYILTYEWEGQVVSEEEYNAKINEVFDMEKSISPNENYIYTEMVSMLTTGTWTSSNHTYELMKADVTWQEAQDICHEKGGYLATITCADEQAAISALIEQENMTDCVFYVGFRSCEWVGEDFRSYRWVLGDGTELEYMNTTFLSARALHDPNFQDYSSDAKAGLVRYHDETKKIYMIDAPDNLWKEAPEYTGNMGFICEYDAAGMS